MNLQYVKCLALYSTCSNSGWCDDSIYVLFLFLIKLIVIQDRIYLISLDADVDKVVILFFRPLIR